MESILKCPPNPQDARNIRQSKVVQHPRFPEYRHDSFVLNWHQPLLFRKHRFKRVWPNATVAALVDGDKCEAPANSAAIEHQNGIDSHTKMAVRSLKTFAYLQKKFKIAYNTFGENKQKKCSVTEPITKGFVYLSLYLISRIIS